MRPPALRRLAAGTLRHPGPDLHRLPVGLDPRGLSLAEGVRAVLASSVFLALDLWLHSAPLLIAATGAMITCFCDVGGTLRQRLPVLLAFTGLGAVTWAGFGSLRALGVAPVLVAAVPAVFGLSMARVWGLRAQTVGNVAVVVLALAVDEPLSLPAALDFLLFFVAGGLWASLLTVAIWRIRPDRPARRAVELVLAELAALSGDLRGLILRRAEPAEWDAHARDHRRAVRTQIEAARLLVAASANRRGLVSGGAQRAALVLEAADQLFGELVVLSEMAEGTRDGNLRAAAARLLRRVRPVLRLASRGGPGEAERLLAAVDRAAAAPMPPDLSALGRLIADHLRMVVQVPALPASSLRDATRRRDAGPWRARVWGPLRDELTWRSAILRHATRATLLTVPALGVGLLWWTPYAHWLSITVVLTMQPYFAATWQRALERIGGTVAGALLGGALAFLPPTPLATAAALLPLSIIGYSVRQVSYGAFIACLTPLIVLLFDIAQPGHSPWVVAGMRTLYTLVGGVVAVGACTLLWPSWEPDRLRGELRATLRAYGRLAAAVLGEPSADRPEATEAARRAAGVANSNLEASLSRALQEPGARRGTGLVRVLAVDAALRRLGGTLLAVPHDAAARGVLEGPARGEWRAAVEGAFAALAEGRAPPRLPPLGEGAAPPTLERIRRTLGLLAEMLAGEEAGQSSPKGSPGRSRS